MCALFEHGFVDPWHLTEHGDELEVAVAAQEMDLRLTPGCCRSAEFLYAVLFQRCKCSVASRYVAVKTIPQFVELAGSGSECRPDLHGMIAGVGCAAATFEAVIRSEIAIRPQIEGIGIPAVAKRGIGCVHHFVWLGICEFSVDDSCRWNVNEIVARRKCRQDS